MSIKLSELKDEKYLLAFHKDLYNIIKPLNRLGHYSLYRGNDIIIANLYGQYSWSRGRRLTEYDKLESAIRKCLDGNKDLLQKKIGIPYKIGCGLAGGDWNIVSKILENIEKDYNFEFNVYELK